jgi:hypothetical protein
VPKNIPQHIIPEDVLKFFRKINVKAIPDESLFRSKLNTTIGKHRLPCTYGFGGLHGSVAQYHEAATETRVIENRDVASMYPTMMIRYHFASRNIPSSDVFEDVYYKRLKAKADGDKATNMTLKPVLNKAFGAMGNEHNAMYDPLMARSITITGQLLLTALAVALDMKCKTLKLLNLNTDGVMYSVDRTELPQVERIVKRWEELSMMELETDAIEEVFIKDVNNLVFRKEGGRIKKIGSYLVHGITESGVWNINNNFPVIKKAILAYLTQGVPVEDTIYACEDILEFQMIAKASSKYSKVFYYTNTEKVEAQRCNRVYASPNFSDGGLYKAHRDTGALSRIGNLPEHQLIDNRNELTLSDIDRAWYVSKAKEMLSDFTGANVDFEQLSFVA